MKDAIGWASSFLVVATILSQVRKQWLSETSEGLSVLLFIGQFVASCGFMLYSFLVHDWIFTITNGLMAVAAVIGFSLFVKHRHAGRSGSTPLNEAPTN